MHRRSQSQASHTGVVDNEVAVETAHSLQFSENCRSPQNAVRSDVSRRTCRVLGREYRELFKPLNGLEQELQRVLVWNRARFFQPSLVFLVL